MHLDESWDVLPSWTRARSRRGNDFRRTAPALVARLVVNRMLSAAEQEQFRELLKEPDLALAPGDQRGRFFPSSREVCLVGSAAVWWIIAASPQSLSDHAARFRQRQVFVWILADHQRQHLVTITTSVAAIGLDDDSRDADDRQLAVDLRRSLVRYSARYHFVAVSTEDRVERFFLAMLEHLACERLLAEAEREVDHVHHLVTAMAESREDVRRKMSDDSRNIVLGMMAFVLSPLGVVVSFAQVAAGSAWPVCLATFAAMVASTAASWPIAKALIPADVEALRALVRQRWSGRGKHRSEGANGP